MGANRSGETSFRLTLASDVRSSERSRAQSAPLARGLSVFTESHGHSASLG